MDNTSHTHQTGQARGKLMRLEQKLAQVKRSFDKGTRHRLVGGVMLLIGVVALIVFLVNGGQFNAVIAVAGLCIGGLVFIKALVKRQGARRSIQSITDGVTGARTRLEELEDQPD